MLSKAIRPTQTMRLRIKHDNPQVGFELNTRRGRFRLHSASTSLAERGFGKPFVSSIVAIEIPTPDNPTTVRSQLSADLPTGESVKAWRAGFDVPDVVLAGTDLEVIIESLISSGWGEVCW